MKPPHGEAPVTLCAKSQSSWQKGQAMQRIAAIRSPVSEEYVFLQEARSRRFAACSLWMARYPPQESSASREGL